eukprot:COSAG01_NODE_9913_length_2302_cov_20.342261_1_plen_680_part_00
MVPALAVGLLLCCLCVCWYCRRGGVQVEHSMDIEDGLAEGDFQGEFSLVHRMRGGTGSTDSPAQVDGDKMHYQIRFRYTQGLDGPFFDSVLDVASDATGAQLKDLLTSTNGRVFRWTQLRIGEEELRPSDRLEGRVTNSERTVYIDVEWERYQDSDEPDVDEPPAQRPRTEVQENERLRRERAAFLARLHRTIRDSVKPRNTLDDRVRGCCPLYQDGTRILFDGYIHSPDTAAPWTRNRVFRGNANRDAFILTEPLESLTNSYLGRQDELVQLMEQHGYDRNRYQAKLDELGRNLPRVAGYAIEKITKVLYDQDLFKEDYPIMRGSGVTDEEVQCFRRNRLAERHEGIYQCEKRLAALQRKYCFTPQQRREMFLRSSSMRGIFQGYYLGKHCELSVDRIESQEHRKHDIERFKVNFLCYLMVQNAQASLWLEEYGRKLRTFRLKGWSDMLHKGDATVLGQTWDALQRERIDPSRLESFDGERYPFPLSYGEYLLIVDNQHHMAVLTDRAWLTYLRSRSVELQPLKAATAAAQQPPVASTASLGGQYGGNQCEMCEVDTSKGRSDEKRLLRFFFYFHVLLKAYAQKYDNETVQRVLQNVLVARRQRVPSQTVAGSTWVLKGLKAFNKMKDDTDDFDETVARLEPTDGVPATYNDGRLKKCGALCADCWCKFVSQTRGVNA